MEDLLTTDLGADTMDTMGMAVSLGNTNTETDVLPLLLPTTYMRVTEYVPTELNLTKMDDGFGAVMISQEVDGEHVQRYVGATPRVFSLSCDSLPSNGNISPTDAVKPVVPDMMALGLNIINCMLNALVSL